jgi:prepilin-type N-terminal cleavage/methylation domain-containing protein
MLAKLKVRKGVSLVELILAIAIFSIVIQVVYSIFFVGQKSFSTSKNIGFAQQEARSPLDYINREIKTSKSIHLGQPPVEFPYYKLYVLEGKLIKETMVSADSIPTSQYLFTGIEGISFHPMWIDKILDELDYNRISIEISSRESNIEKTYNMIVRFENNNEIGTIKRELDEYGDLIDLEDMYPEIYYIKY